MQGPEQGTADTTTSINRQYKNSTFLNISTMLRNILSYDLIFNPRWNNPAGL